MCTKNHIMVIPPTPNPHIQQRLIWVQSLSIWGRRSDWLHTILCNKESSQMIFKDLMGVLGEEKRHLNIYKKIQIKKRKKKVKWNNTRFLKGGGDYMCENVKMKQKAGYQRHVFSF